MAWGSSGSPSRLESKAQRSEGTAGLPASWGSPLRLPRLGPLWPRPRPRPFLGGSGRWQETPGG